jgi:hypothetical protein
MRDLRSSRTFDRETFMKRVASQKREKLRRDFWPDEDAWTGEKENYDKGWFRAPRTIPLILGLLRSKELSGRLDPSSVYLELLARHIDGGVIEMAGEDEHAFAAGFTGSRAVRSWKERMKILEKEGFIKTQQMGNRKYGAVLIVHPTVAVQRLRDKGKVPDSWWSVYRSRQADIRELTFEERQVLGSFDGLTVSKALSSVSQEARPTT